MNRSQQSKKRPGNGYRLCARLGAVFSLALVVTSLHAHGPDHDVIVRLTAELAQRPGDVQLLLERGERYRGHGDLEPARADFTEALRLQPDFQPARIRLAFVARAAGQTNEALGLLDQVLAREPDHLLARSARADLRAQAGHPADAVADYDAVLRLARTARPELYLARARAQLAAGTNAIPVALSGLEEGIRAVGPVPALESMALDLERRRGDVTAALHRLEVLTGTAERKERWLAERGDVLRDAGRLPEAAAAYRAALAAIDHLPDRLQRTIATGDLRQDLEGRLAALPSTGRVSPPAP